MSDCSNGFDTKSLSAMGAWMSEPNTTWTVKGSWQCSANIDICKQSEGLLAVKPILGTTVKFLLYYVWHLWEAPER